MLEVCEAITETNVFERLPSSSCGHMPHSQIATIILLSRATKFPSTPTLAAVLRWAEVHLLRMASAELVAAVVLATQPRVEVQLPGAAGVPALPRSLEPA